MMAMCVNAFKHKNYELGEFMRLPKQDCIECFTFVFIEKWCHE